MLQQDTAKIRRRLLTVARQKQSQLKHKGIDRPEYLSRDVQDALQNSLSDASATTSASPSVSPSPPGPRLGFAAGAFDNGWQLIELIQTVVAPEFWERTGGKGTIRYFAMRRVLVVSATTDVHEQIQDLLLMLSR
jgi:hypothetical protein